MRSKMTPERQEQALMEGLDMLDQFPIVTLPYARHDGFRS
jgi:hypothetical protein